jgi:hypothetical protein
LKLSGKREGIEGVHTEKKKIFFSRHYVNPYWVKETFEPLNGSLEFSKGFFPLLVFIKI